MKRRVFSRRIRRQHVYVSIASVFTAVLFASGCQTSAIKEPPPAQVPLESVLEPKDVFQDTKARAEQGSAVDQDLLGRMYQEGDGVAKNDSEAAKWSRTAAERGSAAAQRRLGIMYFTGTGVPQDFRESLKWMLKAAEQGDAVAQERLAGAYWRGVGAPRNDILAYAWSNLAAANGLESSAGLRDFITKYLTARQIAEAQTVASELFEKHKRLSKIRSVAELPHSTDG